ncbi:MAG: hypothetical protein AAF488_04295 [Planctomycetota bacterium]
MNDRDPRLDPWLDEAARLEREQPSPDPVEFLARLRREVHESAPPSAPPRPSFATALAASVLLLVTIGFAIAWSRTGSTEPPFAAAPPPEIPDDLDPEEVSLLADLDAWVRLAEAGGVPPEDATALEVCDDLEVLQSTDFDAFLASLMEENG